MRWRFRRSTVLLTVFFLGVLAAYLLLRPAPATPDGSTAPVPARHTAARQTAAPQTAAPSTSAPLPLLVSTSPAPTTTAVPTRPAGHPAPTSTSPSSSVLLSPPSLH
jgi:hypothetical protein